MYVQLSSSASTGTCVLYVTADLCLVYRALCAICVSCVMMCSHTYKNRDVQVYHTNIGEVCDLQFFPHQTVTCQSVFHTVQRVLCILPLRDMMKVLSCRSPLVQPSGASVSTVQH